MSMSHESERIVISGASTGLGAATARALADAGYHVLAGVRREADGDAIRGPGIEPVLLDVTEPEHLTALAAKVDAEGVALRAVINNAGLPATAPVETMPMPAWRAAFEVNVFGLVGLTQTLLPFLYQSKGRVVNISSLGGLLAMPASGAYSGSKFAVEAISDALRQEVAPQGIQVVVVEPGGMRTEMGVRGKAAAEDLLQQMSPEQRERYRTTMDEIRTYTDTFATRGVPADVAARTVVQATTAARPRVRYTIGRESAVLSRLVRVLPDRVVDRLIASTIRSAS